MTMPNVTGQRLNVAQAALALALPEEDVHLLIEDRIVVSAEGDPLNPDALTWEDLIVLRTITALRWASGADAHDDALRDDPGFIQALGDNVRRVWAKPGRLVGVDHRPRGQHGPDGLTSSPGAGMITFSLDAIHDQIRDTLTLLERDSLAERLESRVLTELRASHEALRGAGRPCEEEIAGTRPRQQTGHEADGVDDHAPQPDVHAGIPATIETLTHLDQALAELRYVIDRLKGQSLP